MGSKLCLWFLIASTPTWAATKMTVEQLKDTLASLRQAGKSDDEFANRLKDVELTEELTPAETHSLAQDLPGDLANEQLSILEGRSAFLPPPAASPSDPPAPDAAAQKTIMDKAVGYASNGLEQLPSFTATKSISRYQDSLVNSSSTAGLTVNVPNAYSRLSDAEIDRVVMEKGVEKPVEREKTNWGQNGEISGPGPMIALRDLVREASDGGKLKWERWQTDDGKRMAVFSFVVDKKKSHYDVSYCCFPKTDTATGVATMGTFAPVPGQIQSVTSWRPFKKTVGYHGEIFIDPESGAILRVIAYAELKPTDYVHQEAVRIDYAPQMVQGKEYVLPIDSFVLNEVVPGGESESIAYSVRHTLFSTTYMSYQAH